jgi:hypothetical protein
MTRHLATLFFALSALGFALTSYVFSNWNTRPAALPLPGSGYAVASPFIIATSGKFRLEVEVPRPANYKEPVSLPELPAIPVSLRLQINQAGKSVADLHVTTLRNTGSYAFGNIDFYRAEPVLQLARGEYDIRLAAQEQTPAPVGGAIVYLSRVSQSTETFLAAAFVRWGSWAGFIAGVILLLWGARPNHSSKRTHEKPRSA